MLEIVTGMSTADWAVLGILSYSLGIVVGFGRHDVDDHVARSLLWPAIVAVDFYTWAVRTAAQWLIDEPRCNCRYPGFIDYLGPVCPVHPAEYD